MGVAVLGKSCAMRLCTDYATGCAGNCTEEGELSVVQEVLKS